MNEYTENMQFIDLGCQQSKIREKIDKAISNVLDHGNYIMGPEVRLFEDDLRKYTNVKNVISCANGTDAISIALMAWEVGPGDAIFVPSFTYVASAEAPAQLGAIPFFVDVDEDTFNINTESFKNAIIDAKKLGLNPKVVIAVDLFGLPSFTNNLSEIAKNENIKVLVDAAQSFGSSVEGIKTGNFGDITTTSFFPAKPLGCYGDGGAIFTNDDYIAEIINSIRLHGKGSQKYDNVRIGMNSRLDTIQAAILIEKLKIFPQELIERERVASRYSFHLKDYVKTPEIPSNVKSAWAQYTLIVPNRDKLQKNLANYNIPSVIYYPKSLSQQEGYKHFPKVDQGVRTSKTLSSKVLSLPMHPYLDDLQIDKIIKAVIS
ncbi:MAG: DegT/DnrJ/EryC1/StrS family aminotransferase [Gammaproteobacteria bacterium]